MADGAVPPKESYTRAFARAAASQNSEPPNTVLGQDRVSGPEAGIASAVADAMGLSVNNGKSDPQDAFRIDNSDKEWQANNLFRTFDGEAQRLALAEREKEDPVLAAFKDKLIAQIEERDRAFLDSLSRDDWRDLGKAVASDYEAQIAAALARGDMAAVAALRREAETAALYTSLRESGLTGDETRSTLRLNGRSEDEIATAEGVLSTKAEAVGIGFNMRPAQEALATTELHAASTKLGSQLLGDTPPQVPPLGGHFKHAVAPSPEQVPPSPAAPAAKPPSFDWS